MTAAEHLALGELVASRCVLELGSWVGETTCCMARTATCVWTVDHHQGDAYTGPADTLAEYVRTVREAGVGDRVVTVVGKFSATLLHLRRHSFGVVLVDGSHDELEVGFDVVAALELVDRAGTILVHDWDRWGVSAGAGAYLGRPDRVIDSLAVFGGPFPR